MSPLRTISRRRNFWIFPDGVAGIAGVTTSFSGMYWMAKLLRLEEFAHGREVEGGAGSRHHHRAGALAQALVGIGDNGDLRDRGVTIERRLDLDDGDVLAAADDDVLGAAGDANVAGCVGAGEVAGVEPTLLVGVVPLRPLRIAAEIGAGAHAAAGRIRRSPSHGRRRRPPSPRRPEAGSRRW